MKALLTLFGNVFGRVPLEFVTLPPAPTNPRIERSIRPARIPKRPSDNSRGDGYHTQHSRDSRPPTARYAKPMGKP